MCGIVGLYSRAPVVDTQRDIVSAMVARMARRGPDDSGMWTDGARVALGFRRLAIIDLTAAANQPMLTPDGRHALVFNGELYNFVALRRELEGIGARFRTRSDTEVVLQAFAQWGIDALRRFNGMFALAWYDTAEGAMVLARDRFGIKPLYYGVAADGVVFGSEYDQVFTHPWFSSAAIDEARLQAFLRFGYLPAPHALFRDTAQVDPGTAVTVVSDGVRPAYRFAGFEPVEPFLSRDEGFADVATAVENSVRRQLVSDVPVGTFLSGGIDSPLVTACAARASSGRIKAFTIGTEDPTLDESEQAAAYADAIGLDHELHRFPLSRLLDLVVELPAAYSEPFADHSAIPTMLVSRVARGQVTVALSGDGADELFWGYPRFRKVLGAAGYFGLPRLARVARYGFGRLGLTDPVPRGIVFPSVADWYQDSHSGLRERDFRLLCPGLAPTPVRPKGFEQPASTAGGDLAQWLRVNELGMHLQMMLTKVDRASMFYGLEVRVPMLDDEVVTAAARLDPATSIGIDRGKLPLWGALGELVPGVAPPVGKKGFEMPMGAWLRGPLRPLVEDLLLHRDPYPSGLFDRKAMATWTADHMEARVDRTKGLWTLVALQLWADHHLGRPTGAARAARVAP